MSIRSELRSTVRDISGGRCEYPTCQQLGRFLAHLHSIGMGGRKSADTLDNVAWLCDPHALLSDGLIPGDKGRTWYEAELEKIGQHPPYKAWAVADALQSAVAKGRGFTIK